MYDKIYTERIKQFMDRLSKLKYSSPVPLSPEFIYDKIEPIPYKSAVKSKFKPIKVGDKWGKLWGCAWFKFTGVIPDEFAGLEAGALIDLDGEGCVFIKGVPDQGLTNKTDWYVNSGKYYYRLAEKAVKGQKIEILVEAGANGLFGKNLDEFRLKQAEIVSVDKKVSKLEI